MSSGDQTVWPDVYGSCPQCGNIAVHADMLTRGGVEFCSNRCAAGVRVWRDSSPPAFSAEHPNGSHPAWWFTLSGTDFGAYYTRQHAEEAADFLVKEHDERVLEAGQAAAYALFGGRS